MSEELLPQEIVDILNLFVSMNSHVSQLIHNQGGVKYGQYQWDRTYKRAVIALRKHYLAMDNRTRPTGGEGRKPPRRYIRRDCLGTYPDFDPMQWYARDCVNCYKAKLCIAMTELPEAK